MTSLKIAFLIRDLNFAGAQRQLVTLAKALDKQNFDVSVLYFYSNGLLAKKLENANITTICSKYRTKIVNTQETDGA